MWGSSIGYLLDDMKSRPFYQFSTGGNWIPSLNLFETQDHYVICAELAGTQGEDINVHPDGDRIVINGRRLSPQLPPEVQPTDRPQLRLDPSANCTVHLMEIDTGNFRREVELPGPFDPDQIQVTSQHGYLWIILAKSPSD